ncbi:MAG: DoxX family protein [Bacteroidetes bacterium]|nr:DoxX family protein [Bacteroidota bacterium]MDA0922296.1 DoxX family protein [Bacteroidota bacterium]MDA1288332.1 DoxX family protein [Bacteroidota bacterium]
MLTKSYFNFSLLFFRVVLSASLLTHGYGKFLKLINGDFEFADPLGVGAIPSLFFAVLGEFIAPIFIIFGFKTRWASLVSIITMAVITFVVHADDPFKGKEKAILFGIGFILLFLQGPGKFSLDKK